MTAEGGKSLAVKSGEASLIFFLKIGCFIGKILGLRQTKKGVKIVATAGR